MVTGKGISNNIQSPSKKLFNWIKELDSAILLSHVQALAGDASCRQYWRVSLPEYSMIIMDAPVDKAFFQFVSLSKLLGREDIQVPEILAVNHKEGYMALSDMGDECYFNRLTGPQAIPFYKNAIETLIKLQSLNIKNWKLSNMDKDYLQDKWACFRSWYLERHLGYNCDNNFLALEEHVLKIFEETFSMQPQQFVHLDYHSRNLMVLRQFEPGVLDFQDAMVGPISYDVVSLLQDAYIVLEAQDFTQLLEYYRIRAQGSGILPDDMAQYFEEWFYIVGVQRHLKNLGVFARLHHHYKKSQYLAHIPTLLSYIKTACKKVPDLHKLHAFLFQQVAAESCTL